MRSSSAFCGVHRHYPDARFAVSTATFCGVHRLCFAVSTACCGVHRLMFLFARSLSKSSFKCSLRSAFPSQALGAHIMSRERSRSHSRTRAWSPSRMREPDTVHILEITEFERPDPDSEPIIRRWPIIYGRTQEAVMRWFEHASSQRECLFWGHLIHVGVLKRGIRRMRLVRRVSSPTRR